MTLKANIPTARATLRSGHTILELALVLVLIAIAATAVVSLTAPIFRTAVLDHWHARVVRFDQSARQSARISGIAVRLRFHSNRLVATRHAASGSPMIWQSHLALPDSVTLSESPEEVWIDSWGRSSDYSLKLRAPGASRQIEVLGLTGQTLL